MIGVIIGSRKVGINPDNVATPIAASLGDLITLSILAWVSSFLFQVKGQTDAFQHCTWTAFLFPFIPTNPSEKGMPVSELAESELFLLGPAHD